MRRIALALLLSLTGCAADKMTVAVEQKFPTQEVTVKITWEK